MRLVADESVDRPIVQALREAGYDVTYVAELAPGLDDAAVLDSANREGRLLLTADKDFGEMVVRQRRLGTGVILLGWQGCRTCARLQLLCKPLEKIRIASQGT